MRLVIRFVARVACAALTLALLPRVGATQSGLSDAERRLARDIFRELIEINTTDSLGNTPRAARAMARRLVAAGFPAADVQVLIGPDPRHGNLVARYRAPGPAGRRMRLPCRGAGPINTCTSRSEEHTSELQSRSDLVCRLL